MPDKIFHYGQQYIDHEDIDSVLRVLSSPFLTQGPEIDFFETEVANFVGAKFAVAVNSATSALHIACLAIGLREGDILWTSSLSFVASANCGLYCGAEIDFVDIDPDTYNISVHALEKKLDHAEKVNKLPKVLVLVHMAGNPADLAQISELCKKYKILIIEDASHALGATFNGTLIGNCTYSDLTVFSFHPVKMITTCEGGMVLTNNEGFANRLIKYRTHGITKNPDEFIENHGPWHFEQQDLGFNYRMPDLLAALGRSQLIKLPKFLKKRNEIANHYKQKIDTDKFKFQVISSSSSSSYHLFIGQIKTLPKDFLLKDFFLSMKDKGVNLGLHYIPIHFHPYYKSLKRYSNLEMVEDYYKRSFSLPIYYELSLSDVEEIVLMLHRSI